MEAWDESYQNGCRIFDADLTFTTDSVLVLRHAWEDNLEQTDEPMSHSRIWTDRNGMLRYAMHTYQAMDYQTFISTPIYKRFTPMTCDDMLRYMHTHSDLYVAADMKAEVEKSYIWLVARAEQLRLAHVLDRIIISCYTFDEYHRIISVYPFKEKTIRQYINHPHNYYRLVEFCCKNNIPVVNLSYCYKDDEGVKVLISKGIRVYIAVEDDWNDFIQCQKNGIYGCVSNYIKEENNKK